MQALHVPSAQSRTDGSNCTKSKMACGTLQMLSSIFFVTPIIFFSCTTTCHVVCARFVCTVSMGFDKGPTFCKGQHDLWDTSGNAKHFPAHGLTVTIVECLSCCACRSCLSHQHRPCLKATIAARAIVACVTDQRLLNFFFSTAFLFLSRGPCCVAQG